MNERISNLLRTRWFIPTSVGVAAFSGGLGLGYFLGKRKTEEVIEEKPKVEQLTLPFNRKATETAYELYIREDEEDAREASAKNHPSTKEFRPDPRDIVVEKPAVRLVDESVSEEEVEEAPIIVNIFRNEEDSWNYENELSTRTPDNPYVIHQDEFFADEMGYTQTTLTYYSIDDILVDELDVPIYGYPNVVGELKFGHGSRDQNVVYVRNERLHTEYEVLFADGSYEVEVMGLQLERDFEADDLKHSNHKFKME